MGIMLSVYLSYAGGLEAIEFMRYVLYGIIPKGDTDFERLVLNYNKLLQESANPSSLEDWTQTNGQGYLCLNESEDGNLVSASVKYYGGRSSDSTAILFSTKISSFGQDSVESNSTIHDNGYGNKRTPERYTSTTKTIIPNTDKSFSVGQRNRSPTQSYENISDPTHSLENSFEHNAEAAENSENKEKLTWHYRPLSPNPQTKLPEINFQSYEEEPGFKHDPDSPYSEEFLRSLDGVKFRPLQRSDPSGRRRSFKKRHSSSSTSSKDSKASKEEELRIFTSLEETEFESLHKGELGYRSAPNLTTRSHSRSRSRESAKETKPNLNESWSIEASSDSVEDASANQTELNQRPKDLPKHNSFEEGVPEGAAVEENEVIEEDIDDFWGNTNDW